jgi:hypothetical protein
VNGLALEIVGFAFERKEESNIETNFFWIILLKIRLEKNQIYQNYYFEYNIRTYNFSY